MTNMELICHCYDYSQFCIASKITQVTPTWLEWFLEIYKNGSKIYGTTLFEHNCFIFLFKALQLGFDFIDDQGALALGFDCQPPWLKRSEAKFD